MIDEEQFKAAISLTSWVLETAKRNQDIVETIKNVQRILSFLEDEQ